MATGLSGGQATIVLVAVGLAVQADLGAYDFSSAFSYGRFPSPPTVPFIAVDLVSISTEDDAAPLGKYEHTAAFMIEAWVPISSDTPTGATSTALVVANEIVDALHESHKVGGANTLKAAGVRRFNVSEIEILNTESTSPKWAHVRMVAEATYTTVEGI